MWNFVNTIQLLWICETLSVYFCAAPYIAFAHLSIKFQITPKSASSRTHPARFFFCQQHTSPSKFSHPLWCTTVLQWGYSNAPERSKTIPIIVMRSCGTCWLEAGRSNGKSNETSNDRLVLESKHDENEPTIPDCRKYYGTETKIGVSVHN